VYRYLTFKLLDVFKMISVRSVIYWIIALFTFLLTLFTTFNLTQFVSSQSIPLNVSASGIVLGSVVYSCSSGSFFIPLLWNLLYLALFLIQHAGMASQWWKSRVDELGLGPLERCLYVLMTCFTLELFMRNSPPLHGPALWSINTGESYIEILINQ